MACRTGPLRTGTRQLHPASRHARAAHGVALPAQARHHARQRKIIRLHKILDDGGIKLGGVVSDINGVSARAMVARLIEGKSIGELLDMARGALKLKREDLPAALDGDLTKRHLFMLKHLQTHIDILERNLAELDAYIRGAMTPYQWAHRLLQTILASARLRAP